MEDNTAKVVELEEVEPIVEDEEVSEASSSGAFVAGVFGGFLAYAVIGGARKLAKLVQKKLAERKAKKAANVVEAEDVEYPDEQES